MNQMFSFFKKPKVLPILVFFLILAVSQARWDYVGSNFYHDEFVRYKIDRFTEKGGPKDLQIVKSETCWAEKGGCQYGSQFRN